MGEGRVVGLEERSGEDDFRGVARNLEELVHAVALREVGFDVVQ